MLDTIISALISSGIFAVVGLIIILILWIVNFSLMGKARVTLKGGTISLKMNISVIKAAKSSYVDLRYKRVHIPFDPSTESLSEIHDSYKFVSTSLLKVLKELSKVGREAEVFGEISSFVNGHLSRHLRTYQKGYNEWLTIAKKAADYKGEVATQKEYPQYKQIIVDINQISQNASSILQTLNKIGYSNKKVKGLN